ncbi:MAG: histidinol phosphate phosphatase domain-containing protein [Deltaproteobacteria bacterium]|nr:histidinol phosphate phosphatase domain-containing protein [Deltaproteobacteria bacterium]MBI4796897.1 histidinol phosphate phosphatase domain-containing protein [Deltaproteobacteria bacterium]
MIDLHTHTLNSDGELLPAELWRRAQVKGYRFLGITDHVDASNFEGVFARLKAAAQSLNNDDPPYLIPGLEFTHLPPALIGPLTAKARALGVPLIIVHGETLVEPVAPGTNRAALEADIDILAHPGLLTLEEAALAREKDVFLEISARKGHCLANGHVARMALEVGASLIVNTDSHAPGDLISRQQAERIAQGAGLTAAEIQSLFTNAESLARRLAGV